MIAAHSDWSVDKRKRWVTIGRSHGKGWVVDAPHPTGDVASILHRLAAESSGEPVLFGIDCPIGLPRAYGEQLPGPKTFPDFLKALPPGASFFQVARTLEEVSLDRPFFPAGTIPGKGHKAALAKALNLPNTAAMSRRVDLKTADRPAAGQLFWTLGANQCGKAALAAWRDLLIPALKEPRVKLWPFDGALHDLLVPGQIVVAETYPAEAMRQVGLKLTGSKQSQESRRTLASGIMGVMSKLRINPSDELRSEIESGFGAKKSGEDPFDSFVGALGMINVINGNRSDGAPDPVDGWEGWVLGQTP
jgi:hypothetical protein